MTLPPAYEVYACGFRYEGHLTLYFVTLDGNDVWHVHLNDGDGNIVLIARADEVQSVRRKIEGAGR